MLIMAEEGLGLGLGEVEVVVLLGFAADVGFRVAFAAARAAIAASSGRGLHCRQAKPCATSQAATAQHKHNTAWQQQWFYQGSTSKEVFPDKEAHRQQPDSGFDRWTMARPRTHVCSTAVVSSLTSSQSEQCFVPVHSVMAVAPGPLVENPTRHF